MGQSAAVLGTRLHVVGRAQNHSHWTYARGTLYP